MLSRSLRPSPQFRLELPLDTLVQEAPLSVKLSKVRRAARAASPAALTCGAPSGDW
jgi:hypothetical protein